MSFPKILFITSISIFLIIGVTALVKKTSNSSNEPELATKKIELNVGKDLSKASIEKIKTTPIQNSPQLVKELSNVVSNANSAQIVQAISPELSKVLPSPSTSIVAPSPLQTPEDFPSVDRIYQLFTTGQNKLPIVETITYNSSVPWLKGRPAWVADYAAHYSTSRHFIARSLNGKTDYFSQNVSTGSRFNVFRKDKRINFYMLIDLSRCKLGLYYVDLDKNERVLLKTYNVGLGRLDSKSISGSLTPFGKYSLGSKIAIYKPGTIGRFAEQQVEMMRVFGTRWIPFDQELDGCTASSKGLGLHGAPWYEESGKLVENRECIGKYDSDGCIRLAIEDMEEIFSIVITKPTLIEIVKDFRNAKLPGKER